MQYLYSGGCNNLELLPGDVLELMAAASFFQLEGLLRYTEARCADIIDIDNVVAMYIHAKVISTRNWIVKPIFWNLNCASLFLIIFILNATEQFLIKNIHFKKLFQVYNASKLMEYCQGFLLQNMVALLTYDDSVKRLLFAKKIPNHDVLSGLLSTLQQRIKTRRTTQSVAKPVPVSSPTNNHIALNKSSNSNNLKIE